MLTLLAMLRAGSVPGPPLAALLVLATVWYGAEALMARASGWHISARAPLVWMLRDLLLPVLRVQAWLGSSFVWRGNQMHVAEPGPPAETVMQMIQESANSLAYRVEERIEAC